MFKAESTQGDLNGFLDAGSHMKGELHFEDTFRIDGKLTGNIVSKGDLIVGEPGEVDGEIRVRRIFVSGTVSGVMKASGRVEIAPTGKVRADIFSPSLSIEEGAFFEGSCSMENNARVEQPDRRKVAKMAIAKKR
ncbi:MAG: polymer-forming cytoskeletal protein [bacterium]|nr:polymer-forming cytoskeletal protein [bacterium]